MAKLEQHGQRLGDVVRYVAAAVEPPVTQHRHATVADPTHRDPRVDLGTGQRIFGHGAHSSSSATHSSAPSLISAITASPA
ncbi:MAG: hypothetical protein WAK86_06180 [Pseudonocardiaceae bacterium]